MIVRAEQKLLREATETIIALRAENSELKEKVSLEWDGVAAERDALRKENNELRSALMKENAYLENCLVEAKKENARLRAALKPFADHVDPGFFEAGNGDHWVTIADCKRAAAALSPPSQSPLSPASGSSVPDRSSVPDGGSHPP